MELLRLNLGCGRKPLPGFVNVDLLDEEGVDVHADVAGPLPFEDASAEVVYASHVLEHLSHARVPDVLQEWRRVLCPGGRLLIAVPDLETIARMLVERRGWFTPPHEPWIGAIYGGQKDEFDFHKTGFTAAWLTQLLADAGFGRVRRVTRFRDIGSNDGSWSLAPFGINVSLNLEATAGAELPLRPLLEPRWYEAAFDRLDAALAFSLRASAYLRARMMLRRLRRIDRSLAEAQPAAGDT